MINYAEPGSGDELDAAVDSDDSEFATGSGIKQPAASRSQFRPWNPPGVNTPSSAASPVPSGPPGVAQAAQEAETNPLSAQLSRNMIPRAPQPIKFEHQYMYVPHSYFYPNLIHIPSSPESMGEHALRPTNLIPIRVELETDNHRIRDCFLWNCNEDLIAPQVFAKSFCADLELPQQYSTQVSAAIQSQIEEHEGIASLDLTDESGDRMSGYEEEECRVLLAIDVQIANSHLVDTIEWDLMSTLSPEVFAEGLCADLGLPGESVPIIAHAVYEEILRHKRDAVEWGAIGGDKEERGLTPVPAALTPGAATLTQAQPSPGRSATPADLSAAAADRERERRERSGMGLSKDKAGLGLSAAGFGGRSWRDPVGRGSKTLRGIWRDWSDAEEWSTRLEELSPEEVERREIERERASRSAFHYTDAMPTYISFRRLRRETSKFQTSTQTRRRR
jgi:chromatin structure-remodeling complex subunit SFH1